MVFLKLNEIDICHVLLDTKQKLFLHICSRELNKINSTNFFKLTNYFSAPVNIMLFFGNYSSTTKK